MKELLLAFSILLSSIICNSQTWEKSFIPGDFDLNGQYLGGSEVMQLVSHKKKPGFFSVPYSPYFELF